MTLFEELISRNNLWNAWIKSQNYAISFAPYYDLSSYEEYSRNIEENLVILQRQLKEERYNPSPLRIVKVPKGDTKRKLYFSSPEDSIVVHALVNVIGPIFERRFSDRSYGHRLAIEDRESKEVFEKWQKAYNSYITRARQFLSSSYQAQYHITDVADFYPSINIDKLLAKFSKEIHDDQILKLTTKIISVKAFDDDENFEVIRGLPPGTLYSHFFANIYLDSLDHKMVKVTSNYIRYVDDICLIAEADEKLQTAKDFLLKELTSLGLFPNIQKTNSYPISDPIPLIEHTQKLKYDLRIGTIQNINKAQSDALRTFRDLFLTVEHESDIARITKEAAGFAANFLRYGDCDELERITVSFLEQGVEKSNTLRIVLASLMPCVLEAPSERFINYLDNAGELDKLIFSQLLPEFKHLDISEKVLSVIFDKMLNSSEYIVRSASYEALYRIEYFFPPDILLEHFEKETSNHTKSKIVYCFAHTTLPIDEWTLILRLFSNADVDIHSSILYLFDLLLSRGDLKYTDFVRLFPTVLESLNYNYLNTVKFLSISGKFGSKEHITETYYALPEHMRQELGSITFSRLISDFADGKDIERLRLIADILMELGFANEVANAFQKIGVVDKGSVPDYGTKGLNSSLISTPLQEYFIDWAIRSDFDDLSDHAGYQCFCFDNNADKRGTIEIIEIQRIEESGAFDTVESWWRYLEGLEENEIIHVEEKGYLSSDLSKVYCIYLIPNDLNTLGEELKVRATPFTEEDIIRLAQNTVKTLEITDNLGYRYSGLIPLNIIRTNNSVKLINLGYGLRSPKYFCTNPSCGWHNSATELGLTTGLYHTGLFLLEMLILECPVSSLKSESNLNDGKKQAYSLLEKMAVTPHIISILARLLRNDPDERYKHFQVLKDDLETVINLHTKLRSAATEYDKRKILLADYVSFRFRVAIRNPLLGEQSPLAKAKKVISALSESVKYIDTKLLDVWRSVIQQAEVPLEGLDDSIITRVSSQTRFLIKTSYAWHALREDLQKYGFSEFAPIDGLIASIAVYQELCLIAHALFMLRKHEKNQVSENILGTLMSSDIDEFNLSSSFFDQSFICRYGTAVAKEAKAIENLFLNDRSMHFSYIVETFQSLGLLLGIYLYDARLTQNLTLEINSKALNFRNPKTLHELWRVFRYPSEIEAVLNDYLDFQQQYAEVDWDKIIGILEVLYAFKLVKRRIGELSEYNSLYQEGLVKVRRYWRISEFAFRWPQVYVTGDIIKPSKVQRHVLVDLVKRKGKKLDLVSIQAKPRLFAPLMWKKPTFSARLQAHFRRHEAHYNYLYIIVCAAIATMEGLLSKTDLSLAALLVVTPIFVVIKILSYSYIRSVKSEDSIDIQI